MKKQKAFTLIELIVVIAILAILAVALIPLINNFIEKSRISRFMTAVSSLESAGQAFNADTNSYPNLEEGGGFPLPISLTELSEDSGISGWDGPYVSKNAVGLTPWGGVYQLGYVEFSGRNSIDWAIFIFSVGGSSGSGEDEINLPVSSIKIIDNKIDGKVDFLDGRVQAAPDGSAFGAVIIPGVAGENGFVEIDD